MIDMKWMKWRKFDRFHNGNGMKVHLDSSSIVFIVLHFFKSQRRWCSSEKKNINFIYFSPGTEQNGKKFNIKKHFKIFIIWKCMEEKKNVF